MTIRVEFFGVPRARAATGAATLEFDRGQATLSEILAELSQQFPALAKECFSTDGCRLRPEYLVSLHGEQFVRDPGTVIRDGQSLLILSTDAGG